MHRIACLLVAGLFSVAPGLVAAAFADPALDARQEKCKAQMNDRIQNCTNDCTARALAAVPEYKDTNNNVKFGCLKGCAIGQIMQMRACVSGKVPDSVETNQH